MRTPRNATTHPVAPRSEVASASAIKLPHRSEVSQTAVFSVFVLGLWWFVIHYLILVYDGNHAGERVKRCLWVKIFRFPTPLFLSLLLVVPVGNSYVV